MRFSFARLRMMAAAFGLLCLVGGKAAAAELAADHGCQIPCPCPPCPAEAPPMGEPADGEAAEEPPLPEMDIAQATAVPAGPMGAAPNMIGDTIGGGCGSVQFNGMGIGLVNHPSFGCSRQKISENNSPIPRSRLYLTYQHFDRAIINEAVEEENGPPFISDRQVTDVDRVIFGLEKTFWCDCASIQVQVPVAYQLEDKMLFDFGPQPSAPSSRDSQLGNVSVALKALLYENPCSGFALSTGVLLEAPTASDVEVLSVDAQSQSPDDDLFVRVLVENDSFYVAPFVGFAYQPCCSNWYVQGFSQVDFDATGSNLDVAATDTDTGTPDVAESFSLSAQTFLRLDLAAGMWIYQNPCACHVTGMALQVEGHYSTTLEDADLRTLTLPSNSDVLFGNSANRVDILNVTVGAPMQLACGAAVTPAVVIPLRDGEDEPFDWEFQLQVNLFRY